MNVFDENDEYEFIYRHVYKYVKLSDRYVFLDMYVPSYNGESHKDMIAPEERDKVISAGEIKIGEGCFCFEGYVSTTLRTQLREEDTQELEKFLGMRVTTKYEV